MANKKIFCGMLTVALAFGLAFFGCDHGSGGGGRNTDPKSITVTGLADYNGKEAYVWVSDGFDEPFATSDYEKISNGSHTGQLKSVDGGGDWTGNGEYLIGIRIGRENVPEEKSSLYVYTGGKQLDEIIKDFGSGKSDSAIPKYKITSASITIEFSRLVDVTSLMEE